MKIAILTLVFNNYGTRLQSYALCKVLKRLGGENASIRVVIHLGAVVRGSLLSKDSESLRPRLKDTGCMVSNMWQICSGGRMNIGGLTGKNMMGYASCETSLLV